MPLRHGNDWNKALGWRRTGLSRAAKWAGVTQKPEGSVACLTYRNNTRLAILLLSRYRFPSLWWAQHIVKTAPHRFDLPSRLHTCSSPSLSLSLALVAARSGSATRVRKKIVLTRGKEREKENKWRLVIKLFEWIFCSYHCGVCFPFAISHFTPFPPFCFCLANFQLQATGCWPFSCC